MTCFRRRRPDRRGRALAMACAAVALLLPAALAAAEEDSGSAEPPPLHRVSANPGPAPALDDADIKAKLDGSGAIIIAGEPMHAALLRRFYQAHGNTAVWPTRQRQAAALWQAVQQAEDNALDPDSFHAAALARPSLSPAERDLLLSDAFLGYADALARGMVPVEQRPDTEALTPEPVDAAAVLDAALDSPDPAAALTALAPGSPQYAALRRAYHAYEAIATAGGWPHVPEAQTADRFRLLQQRLAVEGYLPAEHLTGQLDEPTLAALRTFQEHHGLEPDGKLGAATLAELNVAADARVRQIAVNLERMRWVPRQLPAERVWVNTASAQLDLFRDNERVFKTRVVVGGVDKQTPEFQTHIVSLLYNPPWYIPYSIAQKEILPNVEADPDYLEKHHMTMRGNGSIQQEAGPYSALGRLKFEMPNRFDVYLHDTPQRYLFARDNRRLSHGCVRVQNPRELGSLLTGIPEQEITRAINLGVTNRHMLPQPIPVFIVYRTAYFDTTGSIEFRRDAYQRDNDLWQRLSRKPPPPLAQRAVVNQRGG